MRDRITGALVTAALMLALPAVAQDAPPPVAEAADDAPQTSAADVAEPTVSAQTAESVTAGASRLTLDTTQVTGNRELPKVLVIVPWKNPELVELTGRPLASLVEEALSPIDPAVFRRQVDYYNALQDADDSDGDD